MFTGFPEETVQFFLDLRFHNDTTFFHEQHQRYLKEVQAPFYAFIDELADSMKSIDPGMEVRPFKSLAHIHRDTRFSKDKSPYRDHLWLLFRREAEPREKSLNFWFEFGPQILGWGMGFWGENREVMDRFRMDMVARPKEILQLIDSCRLPARHLALGGSSFKRMQVPEGVPAELVPWYTLREMYIPRVDPEYRWAYSPDIVGIVREDFLALAPLYRYLRGYADEIIAEEQIKSSLKEAFK